MPDPDESIENQLKDENSEASKLLRASFDWHNNLMAREVGLIKNKIPPYPLENCPKKFSSSKVFMKEAIVIHPDNLMYASDAIKSDPDMLDSVKERIEGIKLDAFRRMKSNLFYEYPFHETNPFIGWYEDILSSSKSFVKKAIRYDPDCIKYASKALQKDPELLLAVEESRLLGYVTDYKHELAIHIANNYQSRDDKGHRHPLKNCDPKFISSKSFMKKAIRYDPDCIKYASKALQKDPELLLAVEESRLLTEVELFEYMSWQLKDDKSHPLRNCDPKFISSKSFMKKAIEIHAKSLLYASDELQKDQDLLLHSIKANPFIYEDIPDEHISDKKLVYDTARDYMIYLMENDTLFDQIDSFTEHWADDAEYSHNFAPFGNDEEFASFLFDCIEDTCYNYYDFFAFLGQGPLLLKNHEFMESIYHKMAKVIVRNHHGKIDCMDLYGDGPPSHIPDEEIEMHLSGIKKSIEEIKSKKIAYRSFDGQPLDISNLKSKKKTDA